MRFGRLPPDQLLARMLADYPALRDVLGSGWAATETTFLINDGVWADLTAQQRTQVRTLALVCGYGWDSLAERAANDTALLNALSQAQDTRDAITANRQAVATGKTALAAAGTLAAVKPIIDSMLDVQDAALGRQTGFVNVLAAMLKRA
jgi:hypothetical protein